MLLHPAIGTAHEAGQSSCSGCGRRGKKHPGKSTWGKGGEIGLAQGVECQIQESANVTASMRECSPMHLLQLHQVCIYNTLWHGMAWDGIAGMDHPDPTKMYHGHPCAQQLIYFADILLTTFQTCMTVLLSLNTPVAQLLILSI